MRLLRFALPDADERLGLWDGDRVMDLTGRNPALSSINALIARAEAERRSLVDLINDEIKVGTGPENWHSYTELEAAGRLRKPLDPVEVWAAGVTYLRSRDAREHESKGSTIYDRVYYAERPELFFKATNARTRGPGDAVGIRHDSSWQVPEPELALIINGRGQVVGYTIGNDMSSRDIEGQNPLYLPQAKIFKYSCAIGPAVFLIDGDPPAFDIRLKVLRDGQVVVNQETSTAQMKRTFADLVSYLVRANEVYSPTVLMTGTGIVPPDDFSLAPGDLVEITVPQIGTLRNPVVQV